MVEAEKPSLISRSARLFGWAAMLAGFAYLASALAGLDLQVLAATLPSAAWQSAVLASIAYVGLLALLARAWLEVAGATRHPSWTVALRIYGPAVIAKYLPGSIFQYATRQLRGRLHGLGQKPMGVSSLFEAGMHVACAALVAVLLLLPGAPLFWAATGLGAGALILFARSRWAGAAGYQLLFFLGYAAMMVWLTEQVPGAESVARMTALFLVAWIAGFLVPVAPGGIGIRESVFLALAASLAPVATLTAFVILARLVTIAGDCLFGLLAYGVEARTRSKRQASG